MVIIKQEYGHFHGRLGGVHVQYRSLKAEFHAHGEASADELYWARMNSGASIQWDFPIPDHRKKTTWPLWCLLTAPIVSMMEKIYRNDRVIMVCSQDLPVVAQRNYVLRLIVDEVVATNTIEQVRSTRKEVAEALALLEKEQKKKKVRFEETARLFLALAEEKFDIPTSAQEVRELYLQLLEGELDEDDALDGKLFRKNQVSVFSPARGEIHRGIEPEEKIIEAVETMLDTLHDENNPQIINALMSHFMFEYAHPFYDGNGRYGRFLLGLSLSKISPPLIALKLSTVIEKQKNAYFQAFEQVEKPENRGDATEFIAKLLKFVHSAQVHVIEELETLRMQLEEMRQKLTDIEATDPRIDVNLGKLLWMLIQEKLFGLNNGETQEVLREHLEKSPTQTRRYLRQLVELGLICETPTRPKRYSLSDTACQMLGI